MRVTLVFPPRTSPTYTPIGITSLAAAVAAAAAPPRLLDANLLLWQRLAKSVPGGPQMEAFFRQGGSRFFSESDYLPQRQVMRAVAACMEQLLQQAKVYLETDFLAPDLAPVLHELAAVIMADDPQRIGFSVMFPEQLSAALALGKFIAAQQASRSPELLYGGAAASALQATEIADAFPFITAILTGEGEGAMVHIMRGTPVDTLPGAVFRKQGCCRTNPWEPPCDVNTLPPPAYHLLEHAGYYNPAPVLSLLGGRGCRWRRCRFCAHNASFGAHRQRAAEKVVDDIEALQEHCGAQHLYFADQYVDPELLESISDAILRRRVSCHFHIMARTIAHYTPARLEKAAEAGCRWISWGMESGSQPLLDIMGKGTTVEDSAQVLNQAAAAGISNLLMMIFGSPGSTRSHLEQTFAFLDRVYPHIDAMTASAFVLFENTPFARHAARYGLSIRDREVLYTVRGKRVHGLRLAFHRQGEPGNSESPLARQEVELWKRRRAWMGPVPFLEKLSCEHYLIHVSERHSGNSNPTLFFDPFPEPPNLPARRVS